MLIWKKIFKCYHFMIALNLEFFTHIFLFQKGQHNQTN